jgi:hypothetical protein
MKTRLVSIARALAALLAAGACASPARAADPAGELARQVANPLASLVSVPFQLNVDGGLGPLDGERSSLNLQPVVPFTLGGRQRWKLISRTVVPLVSQSGVAPGADVSGAGDVTQSFFLTPVAPSAGGWLVGAGPVVQLPTGSEPQLSTERWSAGPTAVALRQSGPWTAGVLANHLWSFAGDERRGGVSATFVQPFVNYVTPTRTTFALNTEATYDWRARSWSAPVHVLVNQLLKVGPQPVSVFVGARRWAASPAHGAEGWGARAGATLLFVPQPKRGAATATRRP